MNENELIARLTKVEKQFNKALHKAMFMNLRLKRWVTEDDLKQDVLLRMVRIIKEVEVQSVLLQVKVERSPFRVSYNSTGDSHYAQDSKSILGGSKSGHSATPFDRPNIHRGPLRRIQDSSHDVLPVAGSVL